MKSKGNAVIELEPGLLDSYIGKRLKLRRSMLQLSQEDVASLIGVTFQQVQKYECGCTKISASRLFIIAKVLQVDISYFFAGLEKEIPGFDKFQEDVNHVAEDTVKFDPMFDNQTLELVNKYWKVREEKRDIVLNFIEAMVP